MRRFRVSIRSLMAVVLWLAVGLAALLRPSFLWASVTFSLTAGMLVISILGAACCRGPRRAFWFGFATCGWAYVLLHFGPWFEDTRPYVATTAILEILYPALATAPAGDAAGVLPPTPSNQLYAMLVGGFSPMPPGPPTTRGAWESWSNVPRITTHPPSILSEITEPFHRIGHSLFALLFAYLGGRIARHFYATHGEAVAGVTPAPDRL